VAEAISDPARARKLTEMGRRLIDLQGVLTQDMADLNRQGAELNAGYGTTREEFRQLEQAFDTKRSAALQQYREVLFAMRAQTSADEWKRLTK